MPRIDDGIGYKATDTETSELAARTMLPRAKSLRVRVLEKIRDAPNGMTADEVAEAMGLSMLTIRPRVSELKTNGLIIQSCERRENKSGRSAVVWVSRGRG